MLATKLPTRASLCILPGLLFVLVLAGCIGTQTTLPPAPPTQTPRPAAGTATAPAAAPTSSALGSPIQPAGQAAPFDSPLPPSSAQQPAVTPAQGAEVGGRIVFHSERTGDFEIWSMNPDGSDPQQLTQSAGLDVEPAVSPDGKQIAFVSARDDPNQLNLYIMEIDGNNPRPLLALPGVLSFGPQWSPNGSQIAFSGSTGGHFEVYLVSAQGTDAKALTQPTADAKTPADEQPVINNSRPSWSPDGKKLVFVSDRDGGESLYTLELSNGSVTRLTTGFYSDSLPRWSPDGTTILFMSNRASTVKGLFTVPAAGGEPKLVATPKSDESPAWAGANGELIVFSSDRTLDWEIYSMRADGSDLRQLTHSKGLDRFPAWTP